MSFLVTVLRGPLLLAAIRVEEEKAKENMGVSRAAGMGEEPVEGGSNADSEAISFVFMHLEESFKQYR